MRAYETTELENIGRPAKETVPALIKALGDEDKDVRSSAAKVLLRRVDKLSAD